MRKLIVIAVFLLPILLCGCISDLANQGREKLKVGDKMPVFSMMYNGELVTNESLSGRVTLMLFFRISCPDCVKELPAIQGIYDEYSSNSDVKIMLISVRDEVDAISTFWRNNQYTMTYECCSDESFLDLFGIAYVPQIYIFNRDNTVGFAYDDGVMKPQSDLSANIMSLLSLRRK